MTMTNKKCQGKSSPKNNCKTRLV